MRGARGVHACHALGPCGKPARRLTAPMACVLGSCVLRTRTCPLPRALGPQCSQWSCVTPESRAPAPGAPLCQAPLQTRASASALAGGDAAVPKVAPATGATVFSLVLGGVSTAPDSPGGEAMALLWGSASCCPRGREAGLVQSGSGQSHWAHLSSPAAQGAGLGAADAHPLTSTWDDAA